MTVKTRIRRTVKTEIESDICLDTLKKAQNIQNAAAYYPGCLLDNYLFINYDYKKKQGLRLNRKKARHFVLFLENYVNEWTSDYIVIESDSYKYIDQFIRTAENTEDGEVYC